MGMEFNENIVLGGSGKEYCEYDPPSGILRWVYHVLGELCLICLSGVMGSEADSRTGNL